MNKHFNNNNLKNFCEIVEVNFHEVYIIYNNLFIQHSIIYNYILLLFVLGFFDTIYKNELWEEVDVFNKVACVSSGELLLQRTKYNLLWIFYYIVK